MRPVPDMISPGEAMAIITVVAYSRKLDGDLCVEEKKTEVDDSKWRCQACECCTYDIS
jgi:hypothetical protein